MADDEWARTSIVLFDSDGQAIETVDLPGLTLERQLHAADAWLREHASDAGHRAGDGPGMRLFASWSPADGQHAMTLPQSLIHALAGAGGTFWMDVYPERD